MNNGLAPRITEIALPWWDALRQETIQLQFCRSCDKAIFYPRPICPGCGSRELEWRPVNEAATLYTFAIAEVAVSEAFRHLQRPILAVAELCGVRIPTTLEHVDPADVRIGMTLRPLFDHDSYPGVTLLRFTR